MGILHLINDDEVEQPDDDGDDIASMLGLWGIWQTVHFENKLYAALEAPNTAAFTRRIPILALSHFGFHLNWITYVETKYPHRWILCIIFVEFLTEERLLIFGQN